MTGTTGTKPPNWDGKYRSYTRDENGKLILLGVFDTAEEAEAAFKAQQ